MESRNDIIWQELIESKDFDQLSNGENAFVLGRSAEANYRLERAIIVEAKNLNEEVEPLPLILEEKKGAVVIPLYQTILAVAAAFVLGFLLFRSTHDGGEIQQKQALSKIDTVYVEKQIIDTVIQTKTEYIQLAAKKSVPEVQSTQIISTAPSAVLSNQSNFEADLSSTTLVNKGTSAKNEKTLVLMESWSGPN